MLRLLKAEGRNFRNYDEFSLCLNGNFNVFYGDNGQGKTALLESFFSGLRGKSFRPFVKLDFIKIKRENSFVSLWGQKKEGDFTVQSRFFRSGKKDILFNGKRTTRSFVEKTLPAMVFTPEKLNIIKEGALHRRALVDEMLISAGEGAVVRRYDASLRQKISLLSAYKRGDYDLYKTRRLIGVLNESFSQSALSLMRARKRLLSDLFQKIQSTAHKLFSSSPDLGFAMEEEDVEREETLKKDLENKISLELRAGRPLAGAHRQDILFLFNGRDSRVFCSQGQQRLFVLSLLTARLDDFSDSPLLFLDDVLSELDDRAQRRFLQLLWRSRSQVLLTSCKKIPERMKNVSFFSIKNGIIDSL